MSIEVIIAQDTGPDIVIEAGRKEVVISKTTGPRGDKGEAGDRGAPGDALDVLDIDVPGTGDVWTDVNTLLTPPVSIASNNMAIFYHNDRSFLWSGILPTTVGVGGTYTTVKSDFSALGVADHSILSNLDLIDQHPIAVVIGLQQELDLSIAHRADLANPHSTGHGALLGVGEDDHHAKLHAHDGLDGSGTVGYGDLTGIPASFPPGAHTHTETEITDLDKYTQAEVDQKFSDHSSAKNPHGSMNWRGTWTSISYDADDVVKDGDWTMIANKTTTDRAAPQETGAPETSPDFNLAFSTGSDISVVKMTHHLTTTLPGWFKELHVKVPFFDQDSVARVTMSDPDTGDTRVFSNVTLASGSLVLIDSNSYPAAAGTRLDVTLEFYNSSAANSVDGGWVCRIGTGIPAATDFQIDDVSIPTRIAISYTDLDSVDRSTELDGVVVDSIILISETGDLSRNAEVKVTAVDTTDAVSTIYTVELINLGNKTLRAGQVCTVNIDVPVTQPSQYYAQPNHFPTNNPNFANITSDIYFDDVIQASQDTAYGIFVTFQEAYVSPDWEFVALSGGSGGGGGGTDGGLTDAPADGTFYGRKDTVWVNPGISDTTGLQSALDNKADATHNHTTLTNTMLIGWAEAGGEVPLSDVDLNDGNAWTKTVTADMTFTFSNAPTIGSFSLLLTDAGNYTITWPAGLYGTPPSLTGKDLLSFMTWDGGTTWYWMGCALG